MTPTSVMRRSADQPRPVQVAGRAAAPAAALWERLALQAQTGPAFETAMLDGLPEPARRWLTHAIEPGTPLYQAVTLEMRGRIRIGRWLPFQAVQLHVPPEGYVWAARATAGPLSVSGYDRYVDGTGQMHWRLGGRVPVMTAAGPDCDRGAAGRVALDAIFVPTAWLSPAVTWPHGGDENTAVAEWTVSGQTFRPQLTVAPDGRLVAVTMPRWAKPKGMAWGEYPCGGSLDGERVFNGIAIPTRIRVGYFFGTDRWATGEFFRATVTSASYS